MDEQSIAERTRTYIRQTFMYARPSADLQDDERLLERGIIDSMGVLELIAFLEQEFELVVADADITEVNLGSVSAIARYVTTRIGAGYARAAGDRVV